MVVGVVRESLPEERRVALVPSLVQAVVKAGTGAAASRAM